MKLYSTYKILFLVFLCAGLTIGAVQLESFPQAEITNGMIRARLYLPDTENGYYRGSRFDWSGVISNLEYKGHSYYGQWFKKYSPRIHDAIMGPVEDFDPIGYNEAQPGGNFIKIGIGVLAKPNGLRYSFTTPYEIVNPGYWKIKKKSNRVEFLHKLDDKAYSYEYKKTIQLTKGKPEMVLTHSLKNTGKQVIQTTVYNHNFLMIDQQPTGPDYVVKFPYNLTGESSRLNELTKIDRNQVVFLKNFTENQQIHYPAIYGYGNTANDYDIRVENKKTGAGVRITSDQPISRLVLWSAAKTVCPEPYTEIKVNPGESFSWKIFYQYYLEAPSN